MMARVVKHYTGCEVRIELITGEILFGVLRRTEKENQFTIERDDTRELNSEDIVEIQILKS